MALVDVTKSCLDSITQISEHIEGAVVYLDAGSTESFQFIGAFPLLLNHGVRAICSLESMSSLDAAVDWNADSDPDRKVVVVTSRLLSDAHRYILRCLSTHLAVRCCTIFTSISEMAHSAYPDSPLGPDAFHEYESLLVQDYEELVKKGEKKPIQPGVSNFKDNIDLGDEGWSGLSPSEEGSTARDSYGENLIAETEEVGKNLLVSVRHFPMIMCPLSPRVFVLPSEGSVAEAYLSAKHGDALSPGLPSLSTGLPSDGDDIPPGAALTAHFLHHFAAKMDLKMEIFSLGDLSKTVGKMLTDMSSLYDVGRRKRSAGLLLVDRTLDLLTPCCHGDSLVDRVFSSVPRKESTAFYAHIKTSQSQLKQGPSNLERASLDVQIPLAKILSEEDCKIDNFRLLESIEAFLCGWDSNNSASQILDLSNLKNKIYNEKLPQLENELLRGSLVTTESFRGTPYLEALLDRKTKEGTLLVKKWLQEALHLENILNVKARPGFATKSELQAMTKALAKSQSSLLKNKGIIQLAVAALAALDESHSSRWEAFSNAEKILSVSAEDTSQSLAVQIGDFINKSALLGLHGQKNGKLGAAQGVLSFQDALHLMISGYILAGENFPTAGNDGPFSWQEEQLLKESIVEAILENPSIAKLKFLHGLMEKLETNLNRIKSEESKKESSDQINIDDLDDDQWGNWGDEDVDDTNSSKEKVYDDMQLKLELRDRVDNLFKFLHKLSSLKSRNIPLKDGALDSDNNFTGDPYASRGLLYKLLKRVLGKNDVPGLEYHSSTVGQLFKSGFRRFGLAQAKPSLADQNIILVFVVGGINGVEVREAQEALSESGRPDIEMILGGTTLLTPDDMLDLLLGKSSYF
ncbi:PREDICTED: sec1 family domain-containing protein MIP3 isoform X1 [Fragaria vesca subsp. vesca]|uniref:sec1 family domain-containing protein MIP3 isoform X1 n=2 Tax=Fragaria vesca subsp. vesca TaxID=101020 RepID=UPI0002C36FD1|nr:PREDICTED: sec1 family domain-containing protein MIP3 isoform X1 [Fragaria vesca subsp. vesca]